MRILDPDMLDRFRSAWRCEWCGRYMPTGCDPAHLFSRGAGGPDAAINLASLCRWCHRSSHDGNEPTREQLLRIVAAREGTTPEAIVEEVHRLRRMPKP